MPPGRIPTADEFKLLLIDAVKTFKVLYDGSKHSVEARRDAWEEIRQAVGAPIDRCKLDWKNLRDGYCKELNKIDGSNRYECRWPYFEQLSFLENYVQNKSNRKKLKLHSKLKKRQQKQKLPRSVLPSRMLLKSDPVNVDKRLDPLVIIDRREVYCTVPSNDSTESVVAADDSSERRSARSSNSTAERLELSSIEQHNTSRGDSATNNQELNHHSRPSPTVQSPASGNVNSSGFQQNGPLDRGILQDSEYFFGMSIACRLRQMTPENRAIARADIEERLLQVEYGAPVRNPTTN